MIDYSAWENLANAIVVQAALDYKKMLRDNSESFQDNTNRGKAIRKRDIEKFFRSAWYQELTSVDGDYLIKKLQEEVQQY